MSLMMADVYMGLVKVYRMVWVSGRYGGGKTAFSYMTAYHLLKSGFSRYLVSNTDSVWCSRMEDVKPRFDADGMPILDTVVILDEGGLFLQTTKDAEQYMAFLRKLNVVLIMPSITPVSSRLRSLTVMREYNAQKIGIPLWTYKYTLSQGIIRENERFFWWKPQEIWGIYDTFATPVDDTGISDWLAHWVNYAVEVYYNRTGKQRKVQRLDPILNLGDGGGQAGAILEASENFTQAAETVAVFGRRKQSGRR